MQNTIIKEIKRIEIEHEVKVLFAVEAGSRAWGVSSENSDYDVRFVYIHKIDWYLSIDEVRDVIELPISNRLDMSGWDIRKALKLYQKSNPQFLEWIQSDLVYYESFSTLMRLQQVRESVLSPLVCFHHYYNMAKGNFKKLCANGAMNIKKYLNVLRPLLACIWIENYRNMPPNRIMLQAENLIPKKTSVTNDIAQLIQLKREGNKNCHVSTDNLYRFFEEEMERLKPVVDELGGQRFNTTSTLNAIFLETIKDVWGDRIS